jgi:hypothetical protein
MNELEKLKLEMAKQVSDMIIIDMRYAISNIIIDIIDDLLSISENRFIYLRRDGNFNIGIWRDSANFQAATEEPISFAVTEWKDFESSVLDQLSDTEPPPTYDIWLKNFEGLVEKIKGLYGK